MICHQILLHREVFHFNEVYLINYFTNHVAGIISKKGITTFCPTSQQGSRRGRCAPSLPTPPKDQKEDAGKPIKKDKGPVNKSGGKAKKKWSKGKVWDNLSNLVLCDKPKCD